MKKLLLSLALLPFLSFSQNSRYFSMDGSVYLSRYIQYTGYGMNLSGNIKVTDKIYLGINTGIARIYPFLEKAAVPVSGRLTFFTSNDDEKVAPFGLFEVGYLIYNDKRMKDHVVTGYMRGRHTYFTGVGVKINNDKKRHPYFAVGYSGLHFTNVHLNGDGSLYAKQLYDYRRLSIRAGLML